MSTIQFHLTKYDGPLDLLLSLVQKHKMDIYDIPIVELTEQFLEYIEQAEDNQLEISSEFLVMASQLLWIKSKMLLPKNDDEESEEDPREQLAQQLLEYQKFKEAANILSLRQNTSDNIYYGKPQYIEPPIRDFTLKGLDLSKLLQALNEVISRKDFSNQKPTSQGFLKAIQKNRTSILTKTRALLKELEEMGQLSFFNWFDTMESKDEIIASFLAILNLLKMNKIGIENGRIIKI